MNPSAKAFYPQAIKQNLIPHYGSLPNSLYEGRNQQFQQIFGKYLLIRNNYLKK